jgi:hypothetical protein
MIYFNVISYLNNIINFIYYNKIIRRLNFMKDIELQILKRTNFMFSKHRCDLQYFIYKLLL